MNTNLSTEQIQRIVYASHHDPFDVLGAHLLSDGEQSRVVIRAMLPQATEAHILADEDGTSWPMTRIHPDGLYEGHCPDRQQIFAYHLHWRDDQGNERTILDPYCIWPVLSDYDLQLLGEGNHFKSYERLGAHPMQVGEIKGVLFAVWAPNAQTISVVGPFNNWDERRHPMRVRGSTGVWELFIPDLGHGEMYKFKIRAKSGAWLEKSDPYAHWGEVRPCTASIVYDLNGYEWNDQVWMEQRAQTNLLYKPVSIYEVHLGSWMRNEQGGFLNYRELAERMIAYVKKMGFTHIELLPLAEHPLDASWGYQVTGYFAPTSRYGTPDDLRYFVDQLHQNNIGVIIDWVPAHFPKDGHGLARFDGTALYEYQDPRKGEHKDWGTLIFDFSRNEVRNFLISSGLFWLDKFHIDGLRVDAVASMLYLDYSRRSGEWVPNIYGGRENLEAIAFLRRFNELVYQYYPGAVTIAEESTAFPSVSRPTYLGGLGFTFKWNMGWMNDTLHYMSLDPIYRKYHHNNLTFGIMYALSENFIQVVSHDEVVHEKRSMLSKMPGDDWQKFANLRLYYSFMFTHPGKKLMFMGGEWGQWQEWSEARSLDWHLLQWPFHQQLQKFVADLNRIYTSEPALYERDFSSGGFEWIDLHDWEHSIISFIRRAADSTDYLVIVCNFTPAPRHGYRIGVPEAGFYAEVINSDAGAYGGSNLGNRGGLDAEPTPWQGQPYSLSLTLPPLAAVVFKPVRGTL